MPVNYIIDRTINLIYYAARGKCTGDEIIQIARQSAQDPFFVSNMLVIFDLLSMTELEYDVSTLRAVVAHLRQRHGDGYHSEKTAVITHDRGASQLISTIDLLSDGLAANFCAFQQLNSAIQWLGLEAGTSRILQIQAKLLTVVSPE